MICCPLCQHTTSAFYHFKTRRYHQCDYCHSIIMATELWPDHEQEKQRYLEHNNDVNDPQFQNFVSPITEAVVQDFTADACYGLDFGAGHAPVITHLLAQQNFDITPYDPLFFNQPECLDRQYNFITCCEVIEHFHQPRQMFRCLYDLLLPGGKLYCMTELYHEEIDFHSWNYKNDPTHVFIYHQDALGYIQREFGFSNLQIAGRLIILSKTNTQ